MKRIILLSSIILITANVLIGAILSSYHTFNIVLSSVVIASTGALLYLTNCICLKDGFKVSLMLLFSIGGMFKFVFSLVAPDRCTNNWWLILVCALMAIEAILLIVTNTVSKLIKE